MKKGTKDLSIICVCTCTLSLKDNQNVTPL